MPAEWAPHAATWITWPHNDETWPGKFETSEPVYAEMVAALVRSETVHVNVQSADHGERVRRLLEAGGVLVGEHRGPKQEFPVVLHVLQTDNEWIRDYGAIFVTRTRRGKQERAATDWIFNAWGGKYPGTDRNNRVPQYMAAWEDVPRHAYKLVLEGGSIDADGAGLLLTTEACLLNPNRNPGMIKSVAEKYLRDAFGVQHILWLGEGIVGDDTDGHIDDITRFVAPHTVVTAVEQDPQDENYEVLQTNLRRLRNMQPNGVPLKVLELPMPPPIHHEGNRLPASYANFYIGNRVVLLPAYSHPNDDLAADVLRGCFPDREVVLIDCRDLIWGLGAFHCLTQQVPVGV